jgi:hypothetical protein
VAVSLDGDFYVTRVTMGTTEESSSLGTLIDGEPSDIELAFSGFPSELRMDVESEPLGIMCRNPSEYFDLIFK